MGFEKHRAKLIDLIDDSMDLFEQGDAFKSFHLDGQTIMIDDYLEIKPYNKERLERHIKDGRFSAGPWYILQDEFYTSGESNVRNILYGMAAAEKIGESCPVGYFPDAFGNAGQMPQILKQAGMEAVVFGRGVKPVGFNNEMGGGEYESTYSEMYWQSPDGSQLLGILFANWYNNGMEIPVEAEAAKSFWDNALSNAERFAGTSQLLMMNGCDHQPVQKNLVEALETARKLYPDVTFIQSDFKTYTQAVKAEDKGQLSAVSGELTSQDTDGRFTLINTASAHIDLKQRNREGEMALEGGAEPLSVMAHLAGGRYQKDLLHYAWKVLMQNHPHDSICGCNVDEVNREMAVRFEKSLQVAQVIMDESGYYLADRINMELLPDQDKQRFPFVLVNPAGTEQKGNMKMVLDLKRAYGSGDELTKCYDQMMEAELPAYVLKNSIGEEIPCLLKDLGAAYGHDFPTDAFRRPYMARQVEILFEACVPGLGYETYYLVEQTPGTDIGKAVEDEKEAFAVMENPYLKVTIKADGSYTITHRASQRSYSGLGVYEECGDIGNEYIHIGPEGGKTYYSSDKSVETQVELIEKNAFLTTYRIMAKMMIPESADEKLAEEQKRMTNLYERHAGRSEKLVPFTLVTELTLGKGAKSLKIVTYIDNKVKDHRIRSVFPTGLDTTYHYADSVFERVKRPNRHGQNWTNPCTCEHQQNLVAMEDEKGGLLVANKGLYEYEILPDQENAIAVTLLRSVGEMGDWGVFPAPDGQMQGSYRLEYMVMPFGPGEMLEACGAGYAFQNQFYGFQTEGPLDGKRNGVTQNFVKNLPTQSSLLHWNGKGLVLTGVKMSETGEDVIIRWCNPTKDPVELTFAKENWMNSCQRSTIIETAGEELTLDGDNRYSSKLNPFEIFTVRISL